ncbi:dinucleotide-utilizing enzyme [Microbacterium sp. 10M-3C3]|jgi:hypothetical protein|uniref:dinucleotide-utilizing enzyme n=1 Tax=Microbacterium sp. 10M-3C3 TaxID=2483401 RepID=UPI000F633A2A|nr:dinucleotide-utilizing enzyme [Microbacterium sp. 10M-3C3]
MTARPLTRSIPFWILLISSLVVTGVGAWLTFDRLSRIETAITTPSADSNVEVFVGQPAATIGGVLLSVGVLGLLLSLAVAAIASVLPRPAAPTVADDEVDTVGSTDPVVAPVTATDATEPVIAEDPDIETPSSATPPPAAQR